MLRNFLLSFIPIFVAVDAMGTLPFFIAFTDGLTKKEQTKIIVQSTITACCLAVGFIFLGNAVFGFLGITVSDFLIAGGAILFCLAITDIIHPLKERRIPGEDIGAVPFGTPLMVGPAVLTTSLILISQYGIFATLTSVLVNLLLAGLIFSTAATLTKVLGDTGTKALSKITSLFLAAIAVMMIRKGIFQTVAALH